MLAILLLFYFVPTVVALLRGHHDVPAIVALNILLGWTFVGWIISFVWALADPRGRATTVIVQTAQHNFAAMPAAAEPPALLESVPAGAPQEGHGSAIDRADAAFWDSGSDKNDADHLEEYLIRFPDGAFAQLARKRLERQGVLVEMPTEAAGTPPTAAPLA